MTDTHHARGSGRKPGTTWRRRLTFGLIVLGALVVIPWVSYGGSGSIGLNTATDAFTYTDLDKFEHQIKTDSI